MVFTCFGLICEKKKKTIEKLNMLQDLAFRIPSFFASNPDDRGYNMVNQKNDDLLKAGFKNSALFW